MMGIILESCGLSEPAAEHFKMSADAGSPTGMFLHAKANLRTNGTDLAAPGGRVVPSEDGLDELAAVSWLEKAANAMTSDDGTSIECEDYEEPLCYSLLYQACVHLDCPGILEDESLERHTAADSLCRLLDIIPATSPHRAAAAPQAHHRLAEAYEALPASPDEPDAADCKAKGEAHRKAAAELAGQAEAGPAAAAAEAGAEDVVEVVAPSAALQPAAGCGDGMAAAPAARAAGAEAGLVVRQQQVAACGTVAAGPSAQVTQVQAFRRETAVAATAVTPATRTAPASQVTVHFRASEVVATQQVAAAPQPAAVVRPAHALPPAPVAAAAALGAAGVGSPSTAVALPGGGGGGGGSDAAAVARLTELVMSQAESISRLTEAVGAQQQQIHALQAEVRAMQEGGERGHQQDACGDGRLVFDRHLLAPHACLSADLATVICKKGSPATCAVGTRPLKSNEVVTWQVKIDGAEGTCWHASVGVVARSQTSPASARIGSDLDTYGVDMNRKLLGGSYAQKTHPTSWVSSWLRAGCVLEVRWDGPSSKLSFTRLQPEERSREEFGFKSLVIPYDKEWLIAVCVDPTFSDVAVSLRM